MIKFSLVGQILIMLAVRHFKKIMKFFCINQQALKNRQTLNHRSIVEVWNQRVTGKTVIYCSKILVFKKNLREI